MLRDKGTLDGRLTNNARRYTEKLEEVARLMGLLRKNLSEKSLSSTSNHPNNPTPSGRRI
jgi:hypothetical protein